MSDVSLGLDFVTEDRARSVTTERRPMRLALILIAVAFLTLFLLLPLIAVFIEAFRAGFGGFWQAISEPDAVAAMKLTLLVAAIAVPANLLFGLAASWAIAKFEFPGKSVLNTLIDLPFSVSPVISGLVYVLLFGLQGYLGALSAKRRHPDHLRRAGHRARHHLRHLSLRRPRVGAADAGTRHAGRGGRVVARRLGAQDVPAA